MRGGHSRGVKGVRDQERLIGIETFGAGAVETPQEQVEPMLELCVLVPGLPQDVEQLADHLLEDDGIVGQRHRGVGEGNAAHWGRFFRLLWLKPMIRNQLAKHLGFITLHYNPRSAHLPQVIEIKGVTKD